MGHFLFQIIFYLSIIFKMPCQFSCNFYNCKEFKRSGHQWPPSLERRHRENRGSQSVNLNLDNKLSVSFFGRT